MTASVRRRIAVASMLALTLAGCSAARPVVSPRPWDKYGDTGPLRVYGADPATAGQLIYASLREEKNLRAFLDRKGEPDTLEVKGGRFSAKTIILSYTRPSAGRPHSITLDPSGDGFIPRAPEPLATPHAAGRARRRHPRVRANPPAPAVEPGTTAEQPAPAAAEPEAAPKEGAAQEGAAKAKPSAEQALGCPIDPSRPDCQAFCTPGADHEWCNP